MKSLIAAPLVALALAAATVPAAAWSLPGPLSLHARETVVGYAPAGAWLPAAPLDCATTLAGRVCVDG